MKYALLYFTTQCYAGVVYAIAGCLPVTDIVLK